MKAKIFLITLLSILISSFSNVMAQTGESPTEGVLTHDFIGEREMKAGIMHMLADFTPYLEKQWIALDEKSSDGLPLGVFRGENTMGNNEQGVRHNADFSMICAFLAKYAPDSLLTAPRLSRDRLQEMAERSLNYSLATHKANRTYPCKNNSYWGSVSVNNRQWESSLWAMSDAYSAFFQWDRLSEKQKNALQRLLEAECDYELERDVPTGYNGDTKAEENGWEADVLASVLGLFPDHPKAGRWFARLREFAVNSYSHPSDASDVTVIDPEYDSVTVAQLYKGANLFPDWTLQNHNLFHTSYQNVVMQELGEAALALKLFQRGIHGKEIWKTNSLRHNNREVMENVLNRLALADGELAMPNGNDWSLFLFDQITSYSTMACLEKDPEALFLENMAYKNIEARQKTTGDGTFLLRPDVGARRMGVEAHRLMMTWLMHELYPTSLVSPAKWEDFRSKYGDTYIFPDQNIIRASSPSRFVCFSWSPGLKSYTGYLTSNNPDNNKMIVPFRANNTGNFIGWREVKGKRTNAVPTVSGKYDYGKEGFLMNGSLLTNDSTLDLRFTIFATPGNAVIYLDQAKALADVRVDKEKGGLMAVSTDPFTKTHRTLYSSDRPQGIVTSGDSLCRISSGWLNIDNELGFVTPGRESMAFGDVRNNNSILTSLLYTHFSDTPSDIPAGEMIGPRSTVYLTSVDADTTATIAEATRDLSGLLTEGWGGVFTRDPDGQYYLLVSNFFGKENGMLRNLSAEEKWIPVLPAPTRVSSGRIATPLTVAQGESKAWIIDAFVKGNNITVEADRSNPGHGTISNIGDKTIKVEVRKPGPDGVKTEKFKIRKGTEIRF